MKKNSIPNTLWPASSYLWIFVSKFTEFDAARLYKLYKHAMRAKEGVSLHAPSTPCLQALPGSPWIEHVYCGLMIDHEAKISICHSIVLILLYSLHHNYKYLVNGDVWRIIEPYFLLLSALNQLNETQMKYYHSTFIILYLPWVLH